MQWFGHVLRSSGLAKNIFQGTLSAKRRRGGQKRRWEDDILNWTNMNMNELMRKAEDRAEWWSIVWRSAAAPLLCANTSGYVKVVKAMRGPQENLLDSPTKYCFFCSLLVPTRGGLLNRVPAHFGLSKSMVFHGIFR